MEGPLRWVGLVVTVALIAGMGVYLGPRGLERGNLVIMTAFPADPEDARTMLLEQWNRLSPNNQAEFDTTPRSRCRLRTQTRPAGAFADGRTLYMRNWPVARDNVGTSVPFVAVAPPHPSVLGGQNLAVSAETDKDRAAQALIQFLTSAASQQILSEVGGFVPTRESAFTNARRPDMEQIESALDDARLRPVTPCYVEVSQRFRLGMRRTLQANGQLEEGLDRDLARILRRP